MPPEIDATGARSGELDQPTYHPDGNVVTRSLDLAPPAPEDGGAASSLPPVAVAGGLERLGVFDPDDTHAVALYIDLAVSANIAWPTPLAQMVPVPLISSALAVEARLRLNASSTANRMIVLFIIRAPPLLFGIVALGLEELPPYPLILSPTLIGAALSPCKSFVK